MAFEVIATLQQLYRVVEGAGNSRLDTIGSVVTLEVVAMGRSPVDRNDFFVGLIFVDLYHSVDEMDSIIVERQQDVEIP